jgi:hypothetical protein
MLDAIAEHFARMDRLDDWKERLGQITMEVLFLPDETTGDDLYLKMNARGKELTGFEKFKAWLVEHFEKKLKGDYAPSGVGSRTWKLRLDQEWLEFFWEPSAGAKDCSAKVSACYYKSFITLAINHRARKGCTKDELEKWLKIGDGYQPEEWAELLDCETIVEVFTVLDSLPRVPVSDLWSGEQGWFGEGRLVTANPEAKLFLPERCWLHAITLFSKIPQGKAQGWWFRVVRNLIWSAELSNDTFSQVLRSIHLLGEQFLSGGLEGLAAMQVDKTKWTPLSFANQLEEECLKAKLLVEASDDWTMIFAAENHDFLKGQLEVLLGDIKAGYSEMDATTFSNRWKTFEVLMDRGKMNQFVPHEPDAWKHEALDRLVIRAVLSQCADHELSTREVIQLPWMAVDEAWGDALKRSDSGIRKHLQDALILVLDELVARNAFGGEQMVAGLAALIESPKATHAWMRNLITYGEVLLKESRDWKLRCYHRHWSDNEMAGFLYKGTNRSEDGDILIGAEFDLRNQLIDMLVKSGWVLAGAGPIEHHQPVIYRGHHRELSRDGRKLYVRYQTVVEVTDEGVAMAPRGLAEMIRSLREEVPTPAPVSAN